MINGTLYHYALLAHAAYHFRQSLPDFLIWHPLWLWLWLWLCVIYEQRAGL